MSNDGDTKVGKFSELNENFEDDQAHFHLYEKNALESLERLKKFIAVLSEKSKDPNRLSFAVKDMKVLNSEIQEIAKYRRL